MTRIATAILIALIALVACTEPVPTATHAPAPTVAPTATPEPEPTVVPTPKPTSTPKPTVTPQPTSTPKPTATPEPEVSHVRYCEGYFNGVLAAYNVKDGERGLAVENSTARILGVDPDKLWDYCESVPTVDQILAFTGASDRNCYHGYNTIICLIEEAMYSVNAAENEMNTDMRGY